MKRIACARRGLAENIVALVLCTSLLACGPSEPANELPLPQQASAKEAPVVQAAAAPERSAPPAQAENPPPAAPVAAAANPSQSQSDPFARADVGADDRLRQILRQSDKQRNAPPVPAPVKAAAAPARAAAPEPAVAAAAPAPRIEVPAVVTPPPVVVAPIVAAPPAAAVAAPAAPEPPRPPPLRAIERTQPPFPVEAQREGVTSGRVVAAITVLPNGTVGQVDIVEAAPTRVFDRAVRNTLLRWRFEPIPQQQRANVEIVFRAE
jgi:TonB family protein